MGSLTKTKRGMLQKHSVGGRLVNESTALGGIGGKINVPHG